MQLYKTSAWNITVFEFTFILEIPVDRSGPTVNNLRMDTINFPTKIRPSCVTRSHIPGRAERGSTREKGQKEHKVDEQKAVAARGQAEFGTGPNSVDRVRRHFRFEAKWSETEAKFVSLRCEKSAFFAYFPSMRNVKIGSETKMERSENKTKKKRKTAIIFASKRNEAKQKRKTAIIFALKRNEAKQKRKMP